MILIFVQTVSDAVDKRLQDDENALSHKYLLQGFLDYRDLDDTGMSHERVKNELWGA